LSTSTLPVPTSTALPSKTSLPLPTFTNSPEPTPSSTPAPIPTDTPIGQIFRDDFSINLQAGWAWHNENPARWTITPEGWLQILGEDASLLANEFQNNLLCRNAPTGEFEITVHLIADPSVNFQQATLYLYQDSENYIAINRGYCGPCLTNGSGVFMEYKIAGSMGAYMEKTKDTDVFLRLVNQGQTITGYYAFEPEKWQLFGKIGNFVKNANICLGVSNVDSAGINADLVGRFDYIEISQP
jgi:beta-xylosidase